MNNMKIRSWTTFSNQFKLFTFVSDKVIPIIHSEAVKSYIQQYLPLVEDNNELFLVTSANKIFWMFFAISIHLYKQVKPTHSTDSFTYLRHMRLMN